MKVAVLGRTRMLLRAARALHDHGHEVVLLLAPSGRHVDATAGHLRDLADELGCDFLGVPSLTLPDALAALAGSGAEVAVSVNWPTLVPTQVLELFPHGVLNAHAGDLPRHRGNATISWAILTGEPQVVVTIHRMDAGLDSGPVLAKRPCPLDASTYVGDVLAFCERVVPELFVEVVAGLAGGTLQPMPQPEEPGSSLRCFPRTPADGWIEWPQDAESLARLVRASAEPFEGAYTVAGGDRLAVWRAHAEQLPYPSLGVPGQVIELRKAAGEVAVLTGSGVLVLERVQTPNSGPVAPVEVLKSTRLRLGLHLPTVVADLSHRLAGLERRLAGEQDDDDRQHAEDRP